ncbi:MAG: pilus assembly protein PilM [Candidatus Omnitrophica bacterium]|nr:pilus assembly protein PilM [Candidatus Omnitrophota bacterium]
MASQSKLGLYWGNEGISFIEISRGAIQHKAFLPFSSLIVNPGETSSVPLWQNERLFEHIKRLVQDHSWPVDDIYFSIPSKDIIIRSFVIPWIRPHEIQGVVSFEARKYIPFPLEELTYTYYPSPFVQSGIKQIGVVFVGIRREMLNSYRNVFSRSGLNVVYCEPAAMSFLRVLVARKIIDPVQNVAVLQIYDNAGEISIASNGFVKFIRDFSLSPLAATPFQNESDFPRAKLYNEVRISLDFFSRQHSEDVSKVVVIASVDKKVWVEGVVAEMGMPVLAVDVDTVLGLGGAEDIGAVGAFGATLTGSVPTVIDFNILDGDGAVAVRKTGSSPSKFAPYVWPIFSLVIAIAMIGYVWFFNNQQLAKKNTELSLLRKNLGEFSSVPVEELDSKNTRVKKFLSSVKDVELHSSYTPVMVRLVSLMPESMWLESFSLGEGSAAEVTTGKAKPKPKSPAVTGASTETIPSEKGQHLSLQISGFLFLNDMNAGFDEVGRFVSALRSDGIFQKFFKDIKLLNMREQNVEGRTVTAFSIICQ